MDGKKKAEVEKYQQQRARWLRERKLEKERESVVNEVELERKMRDSRVSDVSSSSETSRHGNANASYSADRYASQSSGHSKSSASYGRPKYIDSSPMSYQSASFGEGPDSDGVMEAQAEVLDRLTQKITSRLKDELREEFRKESTEVLKKEFETGTRMERFLAEEIESHACPICLELMAPPAKAPTMIFKCGHTFCAECIDHHQSKDRGTCPLCRKPITSTALNYSLQEIIQKFITKREKMTGPDVMQSTQSLQSEAPSVMSLPEDEDDIGDTIHDENAEKYIRELKVVSTRLKILANEKEETEQVFQSWQKKGESARLVLNHLKVEETDVLQRMEQIQAELAFVRSKIEEQETKVQGIEQEKSKVQKQLDLVELTVKPLQEEKEKFTVILENLSSSYGAEL